MKVGMISLGCPKNLVDSEVMLGLAEQAGHTLTSEAADADVLIVNTCAFIDRSKQESVDAILEMAQLKKTGRCRQLSQQFGLPVGPGGAGHIGLDRDGLGRHDAHPTATDLELEVRPAELRPADVALLFLHSKPALKCQAGGPLQVSVRDDVIR